MSQQNLYSRINSQTTIGLSGQQTLADRGNAAGISSAQQVVDVNKLYMMEIQIAAVKKKNYDIDFKTNGLFKGMAKMMKNNLDTNNQYLKTKKELANSEKLLTKMMKDNAALAQLTGAANQARHQESLIRQKQMEYELGLARENLDISRRMLPLGGALSGIIGKISAGAGVMHGIFESLGSIFGILTLPLKLIGDLIGKVWTYFLQIQTITGNLAADIGLTAKESYFFKDNFISLANSALTFGGTMEDVASTMRVFSEETNKNPMFNKDSMDRIMELAKGTGLGVEGATKMVAGFDNVGMSIKQATDETSKARDMAARFGLNAAKMLQNVGTFVKEFQGYTFANGLKGINQMVAKAQSLRFDLSAIKSISEKLFNPEGAVEAAANLQVLGGKFAQLGDPFNLMYAAQNAPEELAKGIMEATKGMAKKGSDGMFRISPADMMIIKEAAGALGQSADNMITAAIEQGKMTDKLNASRFLKDGMFNENDRLALSNLITMNDKNQYVIRMPNGFEKLVSQIPSADMFRDILDERVKNENAAKERKNWSERFDQILQKFMMGFTQPLIKLEGIFNDTNMINQIEELGKTIGEQLIPLFDSVFKPDGKIHGFIEGLSTGITGLMKTVTELFNSNGSFLDHLKSGLVMLAKGLVDVIGPYMKYAFGKLFEAMSGIPIIGDSIARKGIEMQTNAAMSSPGLAKSVGLETAEGREAQKAKQMSAYGQENKSDGVNNYLKYGAAGAAVGSLIPVIGTAVGAGLGLLYGAFKNTQRDDPEDRFAANAQSVQDGLITSTGAVIKYPKGELLGVMSPQQNMSGGGGLSAMNLSGTITLQTPLGPTNLTMEDFKRVGIHTIASAITNEQNKTAKGYGLNDSKDIKTQLSI